jgi:hypothetical protein
VADKIEGSLEIGLNDRREVVMNLDRDRNGTGHIVFSPNQARHLAALMYKKADEADPAGNPEAVITCAFCGHAYSAGVPSAKHRALCEHILVCPKHPLPMLLAAAREALAVLKLIDDAYNERDAIDLPTETARTRAQLKTAIENAETGGGHA